MRMGLKIQRLVLLALLGLPVGPPLAVSRCDAAQPKIVIRVDPNTPKKTFPLWLAYLGARMAFHEKHQSPIPQTGDITPSFEEELSARLTAVGFYRTFKADDSKMKDPYWESLARVEEKGFLPDYVWTFHHQPKWPAKDMPSDLAPFQKWKNENLKNHQPRTYGSLASAK